MWGKVSLHWKKRPQGEEGVQYLREHGRPRADHIHIGTVRGNNRFHDKEGR